MPMRRHGAVLIVLLAASACADRKPPVPPSAVVAGPAPALRDAPAAVPNAATSQPLPDLDGAWCHSDEEDAALACAQGSARRANDTLEIQAGHAPLVLVSRYDPEHEDMLTRYRYIGALRANGVHHVVEVTGYESRELAMYDSASGGMVNIASEPVMAPDGRHFAAAQQLSPTCEGPQAALEIWRVGAGVPVREWSVEPWACDHDAGWGPDAPAWLSSDSLRFMRIEPAGEDTIRRAALVIRRGTQWHLVDRMR